jgi:hypothetical protein
MRNDERANCRHEFPVSDFGQPRLVGFRSLEGALLKALRMSGDLRRWGLIGKANKTADFGIPLITNTQLALR